MGNREILVTVSEDEWLTLQQAAEAAGMSVPAYLAWGARILAMQARPGIRSRETPAGPPARRRHGEPAEESAAAAWAETFTQRLSHHAARLHETEI
ncbi:hypothetical protein [Nocardia africana]|nr:hypothetical protein [Nocardia africana]MCC3314271.1 hypothetical protein [Nocardia africana]